MTLRRFISFRPAILQCCIKPVILLLAVFSAIESATAVNISVGSAEVVYTKSQRKSGGSSWPDGSFGVISNGDGTYDFYGANSSKSTLTTGTLADPAMSKQSVKITGTPKGFSYLAGGPVFEDPYSGARLMIYHAEDGGKGKSFYSVLGMAISTDAEGKTFRDLGVIIKPQLPAGLAEVGGGSFAIVDGHMNVYFKDWYANGWTNEVAVARAPMAEIMTNALMGKGTEFKKYHNGDWTEPGLHGYSSHLEPSNAANSWVSASYNTYLNQVVLISSQWSGDGGDLYMTTSSDGVNFGPRTPIAVDPGEQFYPSIVGIGADPQRTGESFYVYYTDSEKGAWGRWKDAQLRRKQITILDPGNNPLVTQPNDSLGYTAEWVDVADYQSEFQGGAPADGWKYVWNPKGKVGKSADYVPLLWSDVAQAYNTTGGATMVPNPKTHNDDYLALALWDGHPGNKKYMPMAGYTIQADDGGGLYRLINSSIQKTNGSLVTKEDGLNVLVYVNDTLIGEQAVSTTGAWTTFDRTLGSLNVGDTVWVAIDPLKTQLDDAFYNFDFSLQRLVYSSTQTLMAANRFMQTFSVPEPTTAVLVLMAMFAMAVPARRRR
jgi:hypothetical protein